MYDSYEVFINNMLSTSHDFNFKNNKLYNSVLEHVTYDQGNEYIHLIEKFIVEEFPEILFENINNYLLLNDKYGYPLKYTFMCMNKEINCSPTSLRYILHSLLILKHVKSSNLEKIVEVGCGYGGLFLAINYFSRILNIKINKYYFIDLPYICKLIQKYLLLNEADVIIDYSIHSAYNYGTDINDNDLFFISNYCFTEIDEVHRNNYINNLFPKTKNGFIIWQTIFNLPINNVNIIGKEIQKKVEEYPQTATITHKNYYVYF